MKIYLAGKIREDNDWRLSIIKNKHSLTAKDISNIELDFGAADAVLQGRQGDVVWPMLRRAIFEKHDYVGPYFIACDHSCGHGQSQHGVSATADESCFGSLGRIRTADLCRLAIKGADLVFAWIDATDAYGTIAELGYAHGLKKQIFIAGPASFDDMWFVYSFCQSGTKANFDFETADQALKWYLDSNKRVKGLSEEKELPDLTIYLKSVTVGENGMEVKPGGWAAILVHNGDETILRGGDLNTSKSELNLRAAIAALNSLGESYSLRIYSDSQYLVKGITEWSLTWRSNGWHVRGGEPVKHQELWEALINVVARHQIKWEVVKWDEDDLRKLHSNLVAEAVANYYSTGVYICEMCGESGRSPYEPCLGCNDFD